MPPREDPALVDEAISATTLIAENPANGSGKSLLGQVIGGLQAALGNKAVSEKDAVILYDWYANTEDRTAIEATASFKDVTKRLGLKSDKIEEKVGPIFTTVIRMKSSPLLASWAKQRPPCLSSEATMIRR